MARHTYNDKFHAWCKSVGGRAHGAFSQTLQPDRKSGEVYEYSKTSGCQEGD